MYSSMVLGFLRLEVRVNNNVQVNNNELVQQISEDVLDEVLKGS
jgi:hypothetical protein